MVTYSRVRRKRMGHINLAAPTAHIWFFKAMPSRLGNLLGCKVSNLERVIYFQDYMVVDPGDTPMEQFQLLTEEEYRPPGPSTAPSSTPTWAPRPSRRSSSLDLEAVGGLREELKATRQAAQKDITKRLGTVEMLRDSGNDPSG